MNKAFLLYVYVTAFALAITACGKEDPNFYTAGGPKDSAELLPGDSQEQEQDDDSSSVVAEATPTPSPEPTATPLPGCIPSKGKPKKCKH